jgi:ABC-2 type transport system ATP-binding protein
VLKERRVASIEAEDLGRTFAGGVEAVRAVDLAVAPGEVFGFLGPNGAGKTTTVRMLTTLLHPTKGHARVAGYDVITQPRKVRLHIGVALQEAGLDGLQTGRELLRFHGQLTGLSRREVGERIEELLALVGLTEAADRRVGTYSGGMRRRLDLAVALVHRPRLLFLDEPTTGLDPASRLAIWQEIRRLNEQDGLTVFLTTQYLEEADQLAGRVAIIADGRIVAEGTPADLKASIGADVIDISVHEAERDRAVELLAGLRGVQDLTRTTRGVTIYVLDGPAQVALVVTLLGDAGIAVGAVSTSGPTLDDVFLRTTGERLEGAAHRGQDQQTSAPGMAEATRRSRR